MDRPYTRAIGRFVYYPNVTSDPLIIKHVLVARSTDHEACETVLAEGSALPVKRLFLSHPNPVSNRTGTVQE